MKLFKYLCGLVIITGILISCTNDDIAILDNLSEDGALILSSSGGDEFDLQSEDADEEATTFSWNDLDLKINTPVEYHLQMAESGTDFADATTLLSANKTSFTMTVRDLNAQLFKLGFEPDSAGNIDTRVIARLGSGNSKDYRSNIFTASVTPYSDIVDISTEWGIVGDATPNDWDGPDIPFWEGGEKDIYVAYDSLSVGEIKFRKNDSWDDGDYGGTDGALAEGGDNIEIPSAGKYKITMNLNDLSYSIEEFSLGIVGDAAPNGWDGPDLELDFDSDSNTFKTVAILSDGEIKFRLNNDFSQPNWGGTDGSLVADGDNISVEEGIYVITVDLNNETYSLEELEHHWGIVGDAAPNGWDGPDIALKIDYTSDYASGNGVWYAENVHLSDGEIKFRADNQWDEDYGSDNADGSLQPGGGNLPIKSGDYDIEFNLGDLTYSIEPH